MKVELTDDEREYLAEKAFWDSKYAEVDCWTAEYIHKNNKKAIKHTKEVYDWYNNLYHKFKGDRNDEAREDVS